ERRGFQFGFTSEAANLKETAIFFHVRQSCDAIDVDQVGRPRDAQLHHRNEALPTTQNLRVVSMLLQELDGFRNGGRTQVLKRWRDHRIPASQEVRFCTPDATEWELMVQERREKLYHNQGAGRNRGFN